MSTILHPLWQFLPEGGQKLNIVPAAVHKTIPRPVSAAKVSGGIQGHLAHTADPLGYKFAHSLRYRASEKALVGRREIRERSVNRHSVKTPSVGRPCAVVSVFQDAARPELNGAQRKPLSSELLAVEHRVSFPGNG